MNSEHFAQSQAARRVTLGSIVVSCLTTIHHVYGAFIYHTAWRVHAAILSGLATVLIAASAHCLERHRKPNLRTLSLWVFVVTAFMVPFLGFGMFEGGYNHLLKVSLYFTTHSPELMARLFPAPTYEMPENSLFEITGVLQIVPGLMTGYYLYRFIRITSDEFSLKSSGNGLRSAKD